MAVAMMAVSMALADDVKYKDVKSAEAAFLPATPHALTRDGRLALAKKLKPNEDKGFTIMGSSETEEDPIGSPHAPDGEGWEHDGRKHTKSTFSMPCVRFRKE